LGLKRLARYYSTKRNEYLNHYNVFSQDIWAKKLKDVNLKVVIAQQYLSKSTIEIWDFLAFLGFLWRKLHINKLQSFVKVVPKFGKMKVRLYARILKKYYYEQCDKGGGLLIVAKVHR